MTQDVLAVAMVGAGSSWGRDETLDGAIAICKEQIETQWGSIYDLGGKTATISCYDVTGNDVVRLEYTGLVGDNEEKCPISLIEHRDVTLRAYKRR